jgi:hypothetical protein
MNECYHTTAVCICVFSLKRRRKAADVARKRCQASSALRTLQINCVTVEGFATTGVGLGIGKRFGATPVRSNE